MALKSSPTTVSKMTVFGSFCCRERLVYASVAAVRVVVFLFAQPWCGQNRVPKMTQKSQDSTTTVSKMTVFGSFCCRERLVYASVAAVCVVVFLLAQRWCGQNRVPTLRGASWWFLGLPGAWSTGISRAPELRGSIKVQSLGNFYATTPWCNPKKL